MSDAIEATVRVLGDVSAERGRQMAKWGEQSHPDGVLEAPGQIVAMGLTAQAEVRTMITRLKQLFPNLPHSKMTDHHKREVNKVLEVSAKSIVQLAATAGRLDWTKILLEEICEAFAAPDPTHLRAELVQIAAVAVAWVEDLDRRAHRTTGVACKLCTGTCTGACGS